MTRNIPISEDRKRLVIEKTFLNKTTKIISAECHISKSSVNNIKRLYNTHGVLTKPHQKKKARRINCKKKVLR